MKNEKEKIGERKEKGELVQWKFQLNLKCQQYGNTCPI